MFLPLSDGHPACKGDDPTPANYLFLGLKSGHPRRSNYADRYHTPAAEGLRPARNGARRPVYVATAPWSGIPIRQDNRRNKAADTAAGTWPNLTGKFKAHDDQHSHATWLDAAEVQYKIDTRSPVALLDRMLTATATLEENYGCIMALIAP